MFVKTLGDDERSADLLFRLYRSIQPRDLHDERPFSSLRRTVEHEALVAVMAGQVGRAHPDGSWPSPRPEPNGYTLAYEAVAGHSLDREPDGDDLDGLVRQVWGQVSVLRATRIAHRDLRLANVFVGEDRVVWLIDFGFSELAADDVLLDGDVAELLASTASVMGPERAARRRGRRHGRRGGAPVRPPPPTGAAERGHAHLARRAARRARRARRRWRRRPEPTGPPHPGGAPCHVRCHHLVQIESDDRPASKARRPRGAASGR